MATRTESNLSTPSTNSDSIRDISKYGITEIEYIPACPLNTLVPYEHNPRANDHVVDQFVKELKTFGPVNPIIVDENLRICDGHLRVKAANRLGWSVFPVKVCRFPSETVFKAFNLAVNKTATLADFLDDQEEAHLADLLKDDFPMDALGYDDDELAERLKDDQPGGQTDPDDVPDPPAIAITQPGDLWKLGDHRILCGDSTKPEHLVCLMDGQRAAMMFTDPPYAIYGSSTGVSGEIADDKMVRPFFRDIFGVARVHTHAFAHVYICCDWRSWAAWWDVAKNARLAVKNCIVWDKGSAGMGSMYRNRHEFVLFAVNHYVSTAQASGQKSGQLKVTDENVWQIRRELVANKEHNAQKPVDLIKRAINASGEEGDVVLDPFVGSGTTIIAAQELNRKCYAMEIEPIYCDVAVNRWEKFTGLKAERIRPDGDR